ncbi:MAG TPA: amino acid racemase [Candidatus Cybelea sp.]
MKHVGIVGCSHEGAALCYRTICAMGAERLGGHAHPEVSLHSYSFGDYVQYLEASDWSGVADLMVRSAEKLAAAGADFLICPDNTIHEVLPEVASRTELPWLHIAEVVRDEALQRGFSRIGLMGTRWLVDGPVYPNAFAAVGLEYLRPDAVDRATVNRIILEELVRGEFHLKSADELIGVTEHFEAAGCDAVALACTELPLVLDDSNSAVPVLDSTRLLARAAVRRATGEAVGASN